MRRAARPFPFRRVAAAAAATITAGGLLVALPQAAEAAGKSSSVTLASGVVLTHQRFTFEGHPESVWTVTVNLNSHNRLVSTSPKHEIGTKRQNLLYLAAQEHGIAGINGDTLYFVDPTNQPRGGVMYQGQILKTPVKGQDAVLYTNTANRAAIGDVGWSGHFSAGVNSLKSINSYNSLENAKNGGITFTDNAEQSRPSMKTIGNAASQQRTPQCDEVPLTPLGSNQYRVGQISYNRTSYQQVAPGTNALFTCTYPGNNSDKDYVESRVHSGQIITASMGFAVHNLVSMISGVRRLVYRGKAWNDSKNSGLNDLGPYMLPESFACVSANGAQVTLGAVDGREKGAAGMTYTQLTKYLLGRKNCYSAMALSGSTDTQLVAKRPGHSLAFQNHLTYHEGPKPNGLVDGLIVVHQ